MRQALRDELAELNPELVIFEGLDDAIVGIAERCGSEAVLVYSVPGIVKILRERDGMSWEEAIEFFGFNIAGCYAGEHTPFFLDVEWWEEAQDRCEFSSNAAGE